MGGDRAPEEIVAGAVQASTTLGIPVVLVGDPAVLAGLDTGGLEVIPAGEVIAMDEDASSVRRKKDSSLVRAAEAVRDGRASAMVSAGDAGVRFIGNVEGRDIPTDRVDVVVTDGFTGNVALKTMEGTLRALVNAVLAAMSATEEAKRAAEVLMPELLPLYDALDPDSYGGAMLLGVQGVCI